MMPVKLSAYAAAGYSYIAWNEYGGGELLADMATMVNQACVNLT